LIVRPYIRRDKLMSRRFLYALVMAVLLPVALVALLVQTAQKDFTKSVSKAVSDPGFVAGSAWTDLPAFPSVILNFLYHDPQTPTPLKLKRAGAAAYPPNGKIYVLGGRNRTDGDDINSTWIWEYDPSAPATPVQKSALLDNTSYGSRYASNMAVATLTDAGGTHIYAIGGSSVNSDITGAVRVYDPIADNLTTLSSDPWPANPARLPGGYAVYNNKLYIFGGYHSKPDSIMYADTWVFDPMGAAGYKWSQIPTANLSTARAYIAGATLDGYIYAVGGDVISGTILPAVTSMTTVERMDPSQGSPVWATVASLPTARGDMGAWAYDSNTNYEISGKIVVGGGGYTTPDTNAYIYDPVANTWSAFPSLLRPRRNYAYTQLNGILYAWGGYDVSASGYDGSNSSMSYDASSGLATATPTPVLPTATTQPSTNTPTNVPANTPTNVPANTATNTPVPSTSTPISEPTSTAILPTATPTSCPAHISDVPEGSTWYPYVTCLACRGIIGGYPDGTFRPNNDVTRGQLSKIVANAAGFNDPQPTQMFEDVPVGSTFQLYIGRLASRGYINGYPCGATGEPCVPPGNKPYFRPYNNATRGQIAKIVSNAAGFVDEPVGQTFEDVPAGSIFYTFTERLASRDVIQGYSCGGTGEPCVPPGNRPYFRPDNNATRGQTAKIVAKAFFPDCQTP
jgi:hypothetical protein